MANGEKRPCTNCARGESFTRYHLVSQRPHSRRFMTGTADNSHPDQFYCAALKPFSISIACPVPLSRLAELRLCGRAFSLHQHSLLSINIPEKYVYSLDLFYKVLHYNAMHNPYSLNRQNETYYVQIAIFRVARAARYPASISVQPIRDKSALGFVGKSIPMLFLTSFFHDCST